jgi:hypothetical protein
VCSLSKMFEGWMHLDDGLENLGLLTYLLQKTCGKLADRSLVIVHLRHQQAELPGHRCRVLANEAAEVVGRKEPDGLVLFSYNSTDQD